MVKSLMVKSFARAVLPDETATLSLARRMASRLRAGDVLLLEGDLGAGKTSFARGMIRAVAGVDTEVPSPTFTLLQLYDGADFTIAHFDLYRLDEPNDILELGWYTALEGVTLVEWPSRLGKLLPGGALTIRLDFDGDGRLVKFVGSKAWQKRLIGLFDENA